MKGLIFVGLSASLDELEQYLQESEKLLEQATDDFVARSREQQKNLSPDELQEFGEFYAEGYWHHTEGFFRILHSSFLVTAYSVFEYEMRIICTWLKREREIPIGWNDLQGSVLERLKNYLKLADLPAPIEDQTWHELNEYAMVRHCIVHANGLVEAAQNPKALRAYASRKGILSSDTIQEEIALTREFCREVVSSMRIFMRNLHDAYWSSKQRSP